jgi:hypothetical protein
MGGSCGTHLEMRNMRKILKFRVFWDVAPCSLIGVDQRFRGVYCLHHQGDHRPDDGGSTRL